MANRIANIIGSLLVGLFVAVVANFFMRNMVAGIPSPWDAIVGFGVPLAIGGAVGLSSYRRGAQRMSKYPRGHCRKCGCDLTGNVSGVCPKCGTSVK
jgi:hypothetical protein